MDIKFEQTDAGVTVRFEYNRQLVASFKQTFPRARWNAASKTWLVEGKRALTRVQAWTAARLEEAARAPIETQKAKDDLAFEPIKSRYVRQEHSSLVVDTRFDAELVAVLKSIPGAEFRRAFDGQGGHWRIPYTSLAALRAALPEIERLAAAADAAAKAREEQWQAEREAERARRQAEREQRDAEHLEHLRRRFVALDWERPALNTPMRHGGAVVVVTGFGKSFRVDADMPSIWGSDLLGHEGELCCYAYYRPANDEEIAALEDREIKAARLAAEHAAALARATDLERQAQAIGECPDEAHTLVGETLLTINAEHVLFGGGRWWVAADDGLWFVRNNGADGDDWSRNNVRTDGAGAIGWRMPRDAALEAELRAIAAKLDQK